MAQSIQIAWAHAVETAKANGRQLYNAELYRLSSLTSNRNDLALTYGRTCYRDYAMTRATCNRAAWSGNPDPIGTAIIAVTADGHVPLGRRSLAADVNPGRYFTFGGFFDQADGDIKEGSADIFACAAREWHEETGLPLKVDELRLISVVYDLVHPHPEIGFSVRLALTAKEMAESQWASELHDLELIPIADLPAFAATRAEQFTESLLGTIEVFTGHQLWR
jgi:8-oxo-dGTP pyrophosphatase MutT (NUDIX family)